MYAFDQRRRFPISLLGAIGLVAGFAAVALIAAPRIVDLSPAPDSAQVPATSPIRITFNRPMVRESVEARFGMDPLVDVSLDWEENTLVVTPDEPWPRGVDVTAWLSAGAQSTRLLPSLTGARWSFEVGQPRLAYLYPPTGAAQIHAYAIEDDETVVLTNIPDGIYDFRVTQDGSRIAYTALGPDGGTDLRVLDLAKGTDEEIFRCPEDSRCQAAVLSPSGDWLTFERYSIEASSAGHPVLGASEVWAVNTVDSSLLYSLGKEGHVTSQPNWTPAGDLSFYDNTQGAVAIVSQSLEPQVAPGSLILNELGEQAAWSPDGSALVFPEIVIHEHTEEEGAHEEVEFYSHLFRVNAASGLASDLSGGDEFLVEDASPSYSPDGAWLAFSRKYLDTQRWTPGRQIWLMRPDGSEAAPLTNDPEINHSAIGWSPDSTLITFMRFHLGQFSEPAEIWLIDLGETQSQAEARLLVEGGYLPQWIP